MPAPRAYNQPAPVKLTPNRCLKALFGFASFSVISLALAADRLMSGQELLIGGVLAYTGISNLARVFAIWRIYSRVSRGETIYVQNQTRQQSTNPALSITVAVVLTVVVLIVSLILIGVLLAAGVSPLVRIAAAFMSLVLWSVLIRCWTRIAPR